MIGHAVVGPAREVELPDLPDLMSPPLRNRVTVLNTQSAAACREEVNGGRGLSKGKHRRGTEYKRASLSLWWRVWPKRV